MTQELAVIDEKRDVITVDDVVHQVDMVKQLYEKVMKKDKHYGRIPGTQKDTLYKAGSEKLMTMFQLVPKIIKDEERDLGNGHRDNIMTIALYHKKTGELWGEGTGSCSTMETKFRYRNKKRVCPQCKQETIIKGKDEFGGGWICWKKNGGCGVKYPDGDPEIENQQVGKIENPDIADTYNTVRKMSYKRGIVSATISATGVSDIFTQDIENTAELSNGNDPEVFTEPEYIPPKNGNEDISLLKKAEKLYRACKNFNDLNSAMKVVKGLGLNSEDVTKAEIIRSEVAEGLKDKS